MASQLLQVSFCFCQLQFIDLVDWHARISVDLDSNLLIDFKTVAADYYFLLFDILFFFLPKMFAKVDNFHADDSKLLQLIILY